MRNVPLPELPVEISVRKGALIPVFRYDDVFFSGIRLETDIDLRSPAAFFETSACFYAFKHGIPMLEAIEFSVVILLMETVVDGDICGSSCPNGGLQVSDRVRVRERVGQSRCQFAFWVQEIVVHVDKYQS